MSFFDDMVRVASMPQDTVFNEDIRIVPLQKLNLNSATVSLDPDRDSFEWRGRFYSEVQLTVDDQRRSILRGGIESQAMHARNSITVTIDKPETDLKNGDRIYRPDENLWYEIIKPENDGVGVLTFGLALAKAPPEEI